jgi:hypothetical protein
MRQSAKRRSKRNVSDRVEELVSYFVLVIVPLRFVQLTIVRNGFEGCREAASDLDQITAPRPS